jgi:hypothetical protein
VSNETFVNYWIGQEPTPPSPGLNEMPPEVDVAPLAFVTIDDQYALDFDFLCTTNSASVIQGWIKDVRANGTKVLFSINDTKLGTVPDVDAFVGGVAQQAVEWGVDGVDLDYEPSYLEPSQTLLDVTKALRPALTDALGRDPLLTAPIWGLWDSQLEFLGQFAAELDFVTTMDYTPWPGVDETISNFDVYAGAIGSSEKIAIGLSCMGPPGSPPSEDGANFTPIDEVETICKWEPDGGTKKGVMLYTYSYDVESRKGSGTGLPDGTFTKTIIANLP